MMQVPSLVSQQLSRKLGLRVVRARTLARMEMMLDHYRAASEAAQARLHPDLEARLVLLGRLLKPRRAKGHAKIRVGAPHDGGYVMLDDLSRLQTAFSLGVGPNVDWDFEMARRGGDVYQFDHTVVGPPRQHARFHFHKRRIDGKSSSETENLESLLERYGPVKEGSAVLKVDIEGSEWPFFATAESSALQQFPQILCELHVLGSLHDDAAYPTMTEALSRLRQCFEVVHLHGNNFGGRVLVAGQVFFPHVLEVTLANKRMYEFADETETFPTALDSPNDEDRPDFYLGHFDFGDAPDARIFHSECQAAAIAQTESFDPQAYLRANPDVEQAGLDPWLHWRLSGWGEGRPISAEEQTFDREAYLRANPAVAAAGFVPLMHWRHFGKREGRALISDQEAAK